MFLVLRTIQRLNLGPGTTHFPWTVTTWKTCMKAAFAVLLMFAVVSPAFAIDVPVYPGANSNEMLTKADGENHPGSVAYTTADTFESVYEF